MAVLSNQRHERFAQALAAGKTADDAYVEAGFKPNRGNASTLKAKQNISDRVVEIQQKAAVRTEITIQSLTDMYLDDRKKAYELGQISAAKGAADSLAKLHGYMIDRKEIGGPGDFAMMDDHELDRFIAERTRGLSEGAAGKGISSGAEATSLRRRVN